MWNLLRSWRFNKSLVSGKWIRFYQASWKPRFSWGDIEETWLQWSKVYWSKVIVLKVYKIIIDLININILDFLYWFITFLNELLIIIISHKSHMVVGIKDPSRVIQYRPPTPAEITGEGGSELFMFVLLVLSFIALMIRVRSSHFFFLHRFLFTSFLEIHRLFNFLH